MKTEPNTKRCPKCQAPLPANAPQGLCPKCLLSAVSTPTEAGQPAGKNPPPPIEEVATAFPQLQILEVIGQGGMGVVYKARQPRLDRLVALKLLPQSLAADPAFAERFNREARVLARLNHPNIVTVHDFGQSGGFFYLLMEFVDGVNLRQAMQAGRFTPQQAMMLVPKICEALQFAHDEGILHRDIKPENILLDTKGRVKIADFGIAKLLGEAREKITLTAGGQALGTPHYMAPEQLEHPQDVDQRADIYSLGVVFYEMLTGELPIGRFAAPSTKSTVDPRVDEVVFHALEKEREKRFRSAGEVKTSVEAITAQPAAGPTRPVPPAPGLHATCYFNTPARMRDCFPSAAARIFTSRGELALGGESLTFTSTGRTTITIPLKDIQDLSVGQFQMWTTPWVMKYARLNFLAVTYRREGQLQTVHLTPVEPGATTAGQINDCVGRWFERVRQAVSQCTGTVPHASDTASVSVSAEPAWNRTVLPLVLGCLLLGMGTWVLQARMVQGPIWLVTSFLTILLVVGVGWCSITFLRANSALGRGALDAVTSDDPPAPEPAEARGAADAHHRQAARWARTTFMTISLFTLAVLLLLTCLSYRNRYIPPSGERNAGVPPTPVTTLTPESEGRFVLYTMGVPATNALGVLRWNFKYLVPAEHLARILFVCWSNGVPEVGRPCSAYYKVSKTPMEQDLSIWCEQPNPRFHDPTNVVRWFVSHNAATGVGVSGVPANHPLATPAHITIRSGHQGILRLMDDAGPNGQSAHGQSGIELRIFIEPINYTPVRTDPFETEGTNYVAGHGPGWTADEALKAIKEWPAEPQQNLGPKPARAQPASVAPLLANRAATSPGVAEAASDFMLYTMPVPPPVGTNCPPDWLDWKFKCLLPPEHLTHVVFVQWKDGVPEINNGGSAYFKVGKTPVVDDFWIMCQPKTNTTPAGTTNYTQLNADLFGHVTAGTMLPGKVVYRRLQPPGQVIVHSGQQGVLLLADEVVANDQPVHGHSGIELRIFVEPMTFAPVRTNPFEFDGTNYIAGYGPGWTMDNALKAIKEWPTAR